MMISDEYERGYDDGYVGVKPELDTYDYTHGYWAGESDRYEQETREDAGFPYGG